MARTGDPIVFTNSDFPKHGGRQGSSSNHYLRNFHQLYPEEKIFFLETAARMSAGVSPTFHPKHAPMVRQMGFTWGDGGYFEQFRCLHAIRVVEKKPVDTRV